jgi:4-amino-4-deoxy-L-arabinose transferase-like glycosyltransferase
MNRWVPLAWIAMITAASSLLYFHQLDSSPPYLSIDEVFQARDAVVLAATGRNLTGQFLPLYFPDPGLPAGRDPIFIYLTAAILRIVPFSHGALRAASAGAGVLNVVLIFLVAREMFGRTAPAVVAAVMLMLTPAHFLQSRIGHNQIGTVTAGLAWLLFLVRYFNTNDRRDASLASFCLGLGMYTYASGLVIMPVYFLLTLAVIRRHQRDAPARALRAAVIGFALAFLPLALWYLLHAERATQLVLNYTRGEYNKGLGLKGFVGGAAISHLDAWWDCYNPDKLFFSGDPDLRFSTRTAGYFLLSASVPIVAGIWSEKRRRPELWLVLVSGLVLAPFPAALVSGSEIKRWLTFIPFAVLLAAGGAQRLFAGGQRVVRALGLALVLIARWVTPLPSAVLLGAGGLAWIFARRPIAAKACIAALAIVGAIQVQEFLGYYFNQYRVDSSDYYGGNLPGAIREVVAISAIGDCVLLDSRVYYLEDQFDLYTRAFRRTDLADHSSWLNPDADVILRPTCRGTTALALDGDLRFAGWHSTRIAELNGTVRLTVYRREPS